MFTWSFVATLVSPVLGRGVVFSFLQSATSTLDATKFYTQLLLRNYDIVIKSGELVTKPAAGILSPTYT